MYRSIQSCFSVFYRSKYPHKWSKMVHKSLKKWPKPVKLFIWAPEHPRTVLNACLEFTRVWQTLRVWRTLRIWLSKKSKIYRQFLTFSTFLKIPVYFWHFQHFPVYFKYFGSFGFGFAKFLDIRKQCKYTGLVLTVKNFQLSTFDIYRKSKISGKHMALVSRSVVPNRGAAAH